MVALACVFVYLLMRSPWGRVLKGIREDEDAVRSLGKNVYSYKMQSLVLGGVIGALAGIIYVLPRAVQPDAMGRSMTFFIWTILLLGGAATVFGPVLGTILFFSVRILIRGVTGAVAPPELLNRAQRDYDEARGRPLDRKRGSAHERDDDPADDRGKNARDRRKAAGH